MSDVFLSYAHQDRARALAIAHALEAQGWSVWWDRSLLAGQTFDRTIERELESARAVVVLWSIHSVASEWVRNEAASAAERKVLVPVMLDDIKQPLEFRRLHAANLTDWNGDTSTVEFQVLHRSLSAICSKVVTARVAGERLSERSPEPTAFVHTTASIPPLLRRSTVTHGLTNYFAVGVGILVLLVALFVFTRMRSTPGNASASGSPSAAAPVTEPPRTVPEENQAGVEELKASVVKIVSKAAEGQPRTGTGFVVRVDGDLVYIATVAHVIAGDRQPQVTFFQDKRRPVAAEIGEMETDSPLGVGYLIVRDRAVAKQVDALGWSTEMLRGGEQIRTIRFGGAGDWGVINGTIASVSGSDIRIDARIDEGNSGGPILMNGSVAGMVTSLRQDFGVAKSGIVVQSTLRGWGIEISAPPAAPARGGSSTASPRKYASLVGDWLGSPFCTLTFRLDNGRDVDGSCNTEGVRHEFAGVYDADDRVRITITRIDPEQCKTTAPGYIRIENDDTIEVSQDGWDGCNVKTGSARTRLQRSAR